MSGLRLAGALLAVCAVPQAGANANTPTFNRDIAPIIYKNCADCHRPGEAGPFSLLSYSDVHAHARQIVAATQAHIMPPWLPEPGQFHFSGERRLSDDQLALIRQWVAGGAPEGDPASRPAPPHYEPGWQLGKPDLIVTASKPFSVPASGTDVYWNFVLPVPIDRTRWVRAVEIRPGDKRLVHHANILLDRLRTARELESSPGAGFGGMEFRVESEAFDPDSHLLFWKPGAPPAQPPAGMALRLDPGTDLLLNTHLQPSGKPEQIQPSVGLYFTDKPATVHPMLLEMENDAALKIPAGDADFEVTDSFVLPVDVDLLAIYPHAHYLGKDLRALATLPGGQQETLLHIAHWNLDWQGVYTYETPVPLPKGTTVKMLYCYDNSAANIRNPNQPPATVYGGNRANDEMAHLWLQVVPHANPRSAEDPRSILQEALSLHQVERDPSIFEAQYNLAAMLLERGQVEGAIEHYAAAAQIRPRDPVVRNALGSAELADGKVAEAIIQLRLSRDLRPQYFDAHYNLGLALASDGKMDQAANEFQIATKLKPDDAGAHANLGAVLAQSEHYAEAETELKWALKLQPGSKLASENLAALQQLKANSKR